MPSEPKAHKMNRRLRPLRGEGNRLMDSPATAKRYKTRGACCSMSLPVIVIAAGLRQNRD